MNKSWGSRRASLDFARAGLGLLSLGSALLGLPAFAQIVPDTILGADGDRVADPVEPPSTPPTDMLVEAQGMFMNANGELVLTAQTPTATPHQSGFPAKLCPPASNSR